MATKSMGSTRIMPTLGRPFQLGMLYDCRKDELIPDVVLWNKEAIQKGRSVVQQPKTEHKVIDSDSFEAKASALGVSGSLKASILAGLVELSGSAAYLNAMKTSKRIARVTLQYRATTSFEQLSMEHLSANHFSYPGILEQNLATHVVTAVLHGAQAFFVIDHEVASSENMQEVYENLKATTRKILVIVTENEAKMYPDIYVKGFNCKFFGDFSLKTNPSTFEEALDIYQSLPLFLGTNGENAMPVKVWLSPLSILDSKASPVVCDISTVLLEAVQMAFEELNGVNVQCNDMLKEPAAVLFPDIKSKIQQFQNLVMRYIKTFKKELTAVLLCMRQGRENEHVLVDLLTQKDHSPFKTQKVAEFMKGKDSEIGLVNSFLDVLTRYGEVAIVPTESDIKQVVLDHTADCAVSFTFTSLAEEEFYLWDLKRLLQSQHIDKTSDPTLSCFEGGKPNAREWFRESEIKQNMTNLSKSFSEFVKVNRSNGKIRFVVSSLLETFNPGAAIYLYEAGDPTRKGFQIPKSNPLQVGKISDDRVQLNLIPLSGSDQVLRYRVEYRRMGEESWNTKECHETNRGFTITDLEPSSLYEYRHTAVFERWVALPSDTIDRIKTLPTSPVCFLVVLNEKPNTTRLAWQEPNSIGNGVRITEYKIEYKEEVQGIEEWTTIRTGSNVERWTIETLNPNTSYRFRVSALCGDQGRSDPCEDYLFPAAVEPVSAELERRSILPFKCTLTLDPDTAHCELELSESLTRVKGTEVARTLPDNPKRFTVDMCVLGSEGFSSGRHYWEVQLLHNGWGWRVGVAREPLNRKGFKRAPRGGLWVVEGDDNVYWACLSPDTRLYLRESPKKLGVYLDYEGGVLSLYNADSMEKLYSFTHAGFTHKIFPFFYLWPEADMKLV